jgi:hypothetical protein
VVCNNQSSTFPVRNCGVDMGTNGVSAYIGAESLDMLYIAMCMYVLTFVIVASHRYAIV